MGLHLRLDAAWIAVVLLSYSTYSVTIRCCSYVLALAMNNPHFAVHAQFNPIFRRVPGVYGGKYAVTGTVNTDADTVYVDLQASGSELLAKEYTDSATVYLDLQTSDTQVFAGVEAATVLVDLQVIAPPAQIAIDQPTLGHSALTDGVSVVSFNTTAAVAAGGFIVASLGWFTGATAISSFTGGGLTWTVDTFQQTGNKWLAIISAQAPSGLASGTTLTATLNANSQDLMLTAMSFTGVITSSPVDGTPTTITESVVTGWATPSYSIQAGSVIVACCYATTGPPGTSNTPTSPAIESADWTDSFNTFCTEYRIESSAGSYNIAGTWGASSVNENISVAYKVAPAAPADILQAVDSATVLVDLQASGTELREVTDTTSVYVDLQASATEQREITDAATVYVDLQSSATEQREVTDSATAYVDIQASATDTADFVDSATPYVDIQTSATEAREVTDADTVYVDIQVVTTVVTFPTTPILDNFTRADSASLGASWIEIAGGGQIVSNKLKYDGGLSEWAAAKYTDVEVYCTINDFDQIVFLEWRQALASNRTLDPTTANNWSGYFAEFDPSANSVRVFKFDGASSTQIGSTVNPTINQGDSIGVSMVGSTIKTWVKPAAGVWGQAGINLTDSTYTDAGRIAVEFGGSSVTVDDFGGGTPILSADILLAVDSATVYVDLDASGTDIYTPPAGVAYTDADTALVDLQASGTELREVTDSATVLVDIQSSGTELREELLTLIRSTSICKQSQRTLRSSSIQRRST